MTLRAYQALLVGGVGASVARFSGALQIRYASTKSFDDAKSKRLLLPPPPACSSNPELQKFNYVDKTALLARIMSTEATFLIATSMRRSGKSLVLNQLAEMARGNRALFKGYEVTKDDSPFKIGAVKYPLIRLDFSTIVWKGHESASQLEAMILSLIARSAKSQHNIDIELPVGIDSGLVLEKWVNALRSKEGNLPIVLLIDEYDAPITSCFDVDFMYNLEWNASKQAVAVARVFKAFYIMTKFLEPYFHKVFITGASLVCKCLSSRDICLHCSARAHCQVRFSITWWMFFS